MVELFRQFLCPLPLASCLSASRCQSSVYLEVAPRYKLHDHWDKEWSLMLHGFYIILAYTVVLCAGYLSKPVAYRQHNDSSTDHSLKGSHKRYGSEEGTS